MVTSVFFIYLLLHVNYCYTFKFVIVACLYQNNNQISKFHVFGHDEKFDYRYTRKLQSNSCVKPTKELYRSKVDYQNWNTWVEYSKRKIFFAKVEVFYRIEQFRAGLIRSTWVCSILDESRQVCWTRKYRTVAAEWN